LFERISVNKNIFTPIRKGEAVWGFAFILPSIMGILLFWVFPIGFSFTLSFSKWEMFGKPVFIGFQNYQKVFHDELFWQSLLNTVYFTCGTVFIGIIFSLILAVALNKKIMGVKIYRGIYFLPVVTMTAAVAIVWLWIYNPDYGLANYLLGKVGIEGPQWIYDTTWAMPSLIILSIWKDLGFNMVLYLAALQDIPKTLYEAAIIDGATRWGKFRYITLPLITPTIFFTLIMSTIGSLQVFQQSYLMTQGGPGNSTLTMVYYMYRLGFEQFKMGRATSVAWISFAIMFILTIIQWWLHKKWVFYG